MDFFNFQNSDTGDALYIDGEIVSDGGWWAPDNCTVARKFRQQLQRCRDVTVYINSPGGDLFAGAEIYTMLREHSGKVTVKISGLAASAASVIAMAGDEVLISPVAHMMIHNPWTYCQGDLHDFEKAAQMLTEATKSIVNAYAAKTGKSENELRTLLEADTYMSAETAIREGFADGMLYAEDILDENERLMRLAQVRTNGVMMQSKNYTPAAVFAKMRAAGITPEEKPKDGTKTECSIRAEIAQRAEIIKNLY